ncbi:MAG TPA: hypothetical protein VFB21_19855 [Chthonomonadaceae bacterium]|nr:hypothetical protein [Chthonomonadaceae bacterium]
MMQRLLEKQNVLFVSSIVFSVLSFACNLSSAQQIAPASKLNTGHIVLSTHGSSLSEITAEIAKQSGYSILIDNSPLLTKANIDFQGTLEETLDKVADTFDYLWTAAKGNVILMRKRFKHPEEYPQLNWSEMRQMAQDVVSVLHAIPFDPNPAHKNDLVNELFRSLTQAQVQVLRSGKIIHGKELLPQQERILQQAVLSGYLSDTYIAWNLLLSQLDTIPVSYLQMREWPTFYQKRSGQPVQPIQDIPNHWQFSFVGKDRNGEELITCLPWEAPQPRIEPTFHGGQ